MAAGALHGQTGPKGCLLCGSNQQGSLFVAMVLMGRTTRNLVPILLAEHVHEADENSDEYSD